MTEYGWLMTLNKHRQKDSHAGSASSVPCPQRWPPADVWGGGYGHSNHIAILHQNSPPLLKKLQLRETQSQTCCLSSLAFNALLLQEFIRFLTHSFNTHSLLWQGISQVNSLCVMKHFFFFFFFCEHATSYLDLKTLVYV